ncbi:MAG: hypothetical protein LC723_13460 [Actinobacteria bacterium]|nr:hypothetical protein [Actinomycetota bacterium]
MPTRYINKVDAVSTANTQNLPNAAGINYDKADGLVKYNDAGTLRPVSSPKQTDVTASGALPIVSGIYTITSAGVSALTLAAPSAAQKGTQLTVVTQTNVAHTVTFTGATLRDGANATRTTWTAPLFAGASITVIASGNGLWLLENNNAGVLSV